MGNAADVQEKIRSFLASHCQVPVQTIDADTRFEDDLGLDSFDVVALLIEVEDAYGVVVADAEAAQLETVGQAAAFIATGRDQRSRPT